MEKRTRLADMSRAWDFTPKRGANIRTAGQVAQDASAAWMGRDADCCWAVYHPRETFHRLPRRPRGVSNGHRQLTARESPLDHAG